MGVENKISGDVLVVGGGIAGCYAAIKAGEQGANVILVDKGYVGKSGQSPYATCIMAFNPDKGHKLDDWMNYVNKMSEYVNNRYWTERSIVESTAIFRELTSWGVHFNPDYDGPEKFSTAPKGLSKPPPYDPAELSKVLRNQVEKNGVKILDRVMITELLKQDGRITGAIGMTLDGGELLTFIAKTTILCVGACGFKPAGFPAITQLTCDGEAMAYRAGAEIGGKEFVDVHYTRMDIPCTTGRKHLASPELELMFGRYPGQAIFDKLYNADGKQINIRPKGTSEYLFSYLQLDLEAHAGRAPIVWRAPGDPEVVGNAALGMSLRKADGLWPTNTECASSLPGLYAAGDSLYTIQNGSVYTLIGSAMGGSAVTGAIAGTAAAKEALGSGELSVDSDVIEQTKKVVLAPSERKSGYSPRWVTQLMQNTMMPYFILYIKKADRLQATQTIISFIQEHLVPQLYARDPHELRLAHEVKNMVLSAEMRLKSAEFRTESRGNHYREDYPRRDDTNWLAWTKIKEEQGEMKLTKVPIPKEWWPDMSEPYEERYPFRFPGES